MSRDDLFHTRIATPSASHRFRLRLRLLSVPLMRAACGRAAPSIPTSSPAFKCAKGPYSIASAATSVSRARPSICLPLMLCFASIESATTGLWTGSRGIAPSVHMCYPAR